MNVISLKDYAKENNVSYEAVRQQVVRYKKVLGEHIIQDGRKQFLDEEAISFLNSKRQKNPVVVIQQDKDELIEELENQIKQLLVKTTDQANRIAELSEWKADNALAIAEANQHKLLLEEAEKEKKLLEGFIQDAKKEIDILSAEKGDLSAEIEKRDEILAEKEKEAENAKMELAEAEKEIKKLKEEKEALEKRTFGDYLKGLFRKKGE